MVSTESIELALAKSNLPNHIKLFFLGISGKKVMKVCRRRIISKATPQPRVYEKKRDIAENDMQSRLNEWICIDENISKDKPTLARALSSFFDKSGFPILEDFHQD